MKTNIMSTNEKLIKLGHKYFSMDWNDLEESEKEFCRIKVGFPPLS